MEKEITQKFEKKLRDQQTQHDDETKQLKRQLKAAEELQSKQGGTT